MFGAVDFGIADDGERSGHEQATEIAVTLLADMAEPVLASARMLLRHQPNPGRESGGQCWTDAGDIVEPFAHLTGPVPSPDHTIELQYLSLQHSQLGAERCNTRTRDLGQSSVTCISDHVEQLVDTIASDRRDDAKLGHCARMALITEVCCRTNRWRVRCSVRPLCCSGVLVSTKRMFALVTASQIASASAASDTARTPHDLCAAGAWDRVKDFWIEKPGDAGTAARDANQIRAFYAAGESDLFITFTDGLLYWCRPTGPLEVLQEGGRRRPTVDGWRNKSTKGSLK